MDTPRPDHLGSVHYRVKDDAIAVQHATIRAAPHAGGAILGRLSPGADWHGTPQVGQAIHSNTVWVRSADFKFCWQGALEEVKEE
jgi:hypothetical protein